MRTKDIIITFAALALCCFASSCVKQNDFDSFKGETDSHLTTVEGQTAYLKKLTETLKAEQTALGAYSAALGVSFGKYATEVDSLLGVLEARLKAAQETIPTLVGKSYAEATFATLATVDSLSGVAAAIAVKVQADSTALADSIKSKAAASQARLMEMFGSYYTSSDINAKIKELKVKLDILSSDMDTAVFAHIASLKTNVWDLYTASQALSNKLNNDVKALKDQDTVLLDSIKALDTKYLGGLRVLADSVKADSARIAALQTRVSKLEGSIQSVRVVPDYSDGRVDMMSAATKIKFDIRPVSAAKALVEKKQTSIFSFQIVEALASTKASIYTAVTVKSAEMSGADSLLVLTVEGTSMPQGFFKATKFYNARLRICDGGNDCASSYFALNPHIVYPEAPDQPCIKIAGIWWAPVNCGYHATAYKYGKLYQFGRAKGCGYDDGTYKEEVIQDYSVNPATAIDPDDKLFYKGFDKGEYPDYDWYSGNPKLPAWPLKFGDTGYLQGKIDNPCPPGWRVPTHDELNALIGNSGTKGLGTEGWDSAKGGYWFNGTASPKVNDGLFLAAVGLRFCQTNQFQGRGESSDYWSSTVDGGEACKLAFCSGFAKMSMICRGNGASVRCVLE